MEIKDALPEGTRVHYIQRSKLTGYAVRFARGRILEAFLNEDYDNRLCYYVKLTDGKEVWGFADQVKPMTPEEIAMDDED